MNKNSRNENFIFGIRDISIVTFIILIFCAIFYHTLVSTFSGASYYLILMIPFFIIILSKRTQKFDINIRYQILYFLIWMFQFIIINQIFIEYKYSNTMFGLNLNVLTIQAFQVFLALVISAYINFNNKYDKIIVYLVTISFIINAIITLNALKTDFNISKLAATAQGSSRGIVGYSHIYSLAILMPIILYLTSKLKSKKKYIAILIYIFSAYFIYNTGYFTATIMVILGFIIYNIFELKAPYKIILSPALIFLIVILINRTFVYETLMNVSANIEVQQISERIKQVADYIMYGDKGDTLMRLDLYMTSIYEFFKSPIVGNAVYDRNLILSGHSAFLDMLGSGGLVHFITYFIFIYYSYKYSINITKEKSAHNAIKTSYILFFIIGTINTLSTDAIIITSLVGIIPVIIRYSMMLERN